MQALLYPYPGLSLAGRVIGHETTSQAFHRSGLVNWRRVDQCLQMAGFTFDPGSTVLDFGCGCARLLRFFGLYAGCQFHGADIDKDATRWSGKHVDFASFTQISSEPPTPYKSETFDAVYAYSVFSHLPERQHHEWLRELHRITRPGGVLVLTVQGTKVIERVLSGTENIGVPSPAELSSRLETISDDGFAFFPYNASLYPELPATTYGNTFILEPYIRHNWTRWFKLISHLAAPDGWQDFVVLGRT